jgi:hypothetical protein
MSKHFKGNKKKYFINLRSSTADVEQTEGGNNWRFSWNITPLKVSANAQLAIVNFCHDVTGDDKPYIIRCLQVKNEQYYPLGSSQGIGALIYAHNELKRPFEKTFYPLAHTNIDRIDLFFTDNIGLENNGISNSKAFYIQLEISDYDTEEVKPELMPIYTKDTLSFRYP